MTNHAARGRGAENAVRDELGAYGYDVMRSAGSKGAADLIAVGDGFAVLVQVKLVKTGKPFQMPSPAEREQLLRIAARLGNAVAVAACRTEGSGGRPAVTAYRKLVGPGPKDWTGWGPGTEARYQARNRGIGMSPVTLPDGQQMVHTEEKQGYVGECCHTGERGMHTLSCLHAQSVSVNVRPARPEPDVRLIPVPVERRLLR